MELCNCNALSVPHVHDTGIRAATEEEKKAAVRRAAPAPAVASGSRFTTRVS